jgi:hypothetical protein
MITVDTIGRVRRAYFIQGRKIKARHWPWQIAPRPSVAPHRMLTAGVPASFNSSKMRR